MFDVKICAEYIFARHTLQESKNFQAESHSIIHKIAKYQAKCDESLNVAHKRLVKKTTMELSQTPKE